MLSTLLSPVPFAAAVDWPDLAETPEATGGGATAPARLPGGRCCGRRAAQAGARRA